MEESLIPVNEDKRLQLLFQLDILDTDAEEIYDGIVYIASQVCQMPVSTITLIDRERQWFKSSVGAAHRENPRVHSFCARTILGNDILEVPDSEHDERFKDNPLVTGEPFVRYYAGVPLELKDGLNVGTLCVIDHKPNKLNDYQLKILRFLALQVTKLLELRLKNAVLHQKQKNLDEDLNAASLIQKSFLPPSLLNYGGLQVASFWNPVNLLGGDIFNVIKAGEKIIFYMIDVCGHDVPSALVTVSVSQFFYHHIHSSASLSPKDIMKALNEEYPLERFDRFFTIFYLIIDPTTGHLKYSSAGHPPAVILKKDGGIKTLDKKGMIVGLNEGFPYEEAEDILEDGDKLFLYTDGITELNDRNGEQLGEKRFHALLESARKEPINAIIEKVYKALKNFNTHFQDDVCLLGIEKQTVEKI